MKLPDQYLLSNLLRCRVRCDQGIDHGIGFLVWMHPPVHRVLGWATRPSFLRVSRHVWSLKQFRAISSSQIYVKGRPFETDQITLDRLPTLIDAHLLNHLGEKLGVIADCVFNPNNGKITHYLVSRSDPRLPGSSRWRLTLDRIEDQQPGLIFSTIRTLEELPLVRSSLRQDLLKKSRSLKIQLNKLGDTATDRLEGWLEEPPWDDISRIERGADVSVSDPLADWDDQTDDKSYKDSINSYHMKENQHDYENEEDPWI